MTQTNHSSTWNLVIKVGPQTVNLQLRAFGVTEASNRVLHQIPNASILSCVRVPKLREN